MPPLPQLCCPSYLWGLLSASPFWGISWGDQASRTFGFFCHEIWLPWFDLQSCFNVLDKNRCFKNKPHSHRCVWGRGYLAALGTSRRLAVCPVFPLVHVLHAVKVSTASVLLLQAVPGENQFALILVILERSPLELGTWGRNAAGADYSGHGVGKAPLLSPQWRPFPHANFTQRILLLFIFFIISYLSLPDVFRAVFLCCKLIPFMF